MSKKVSGTLRCINRIQDLLSKEARLIAVETLAVSHINYGITIWSVTNITQLKRVKNYKTLLPKWPFSEPPDLIMPLQFSTNCNGSHPTESHLRTMPNIIQDNEQSAPKLALLLPTS